MGGSKLIRVIIERSLIPLNSLLLFFLLFEPRIILPSWIQVFGRMHPLALHFPIVLILLYAVMLLFFPSHLRKEHWFLAAVNALLLSAAFTASVTALMGFALSRNDGYDPDALSVHKWTGVIIPFILYLIYIFRNRILGSIVVARSVSIALTILISLAGHHGAIITHGENFILAPVTPAFVRVLPPFEEAFVYTDLVQPILEDKCVSCHNTSKSKGQLVMDTREAFLKGGKEGEPWDTTKEDLGILMRRVHMPLDNKEHMPPKGKPQLSDDEIFILHEWVKRGSDFETKFIDLLPSDTLYVVGKNKLPSGREEKYDFAAADEAELQRLSNNNRLIVPESMGSPALAVTFYNKALFKIEAVKELAPVASKIVELTLSGMDVKDEDIANLKTFVNLRKLNLNFTPITGKTLEQLKTLPFLKMISVSGTAIEYPQLSKLQEFPKLKTVYLWSTPAAATKLDDLKQKNKNISYYAGFTGDSVRLQLTPPILENEEQILVGRTPLKLKNYIRGTIIRFTLNGDDPDSLSSPQYSEDMVIDSNVTLKAKAYKPGWITSEMLEHHFYKKSFVPDTIEVLTKPNKKYAALLGQTLNDGIKSDMNTGSGKWVGFDKEKMEAVLKFREPVTAKNITFSMLEDLGAWIFPPSRVEIWGGDQPGKLKLLTSISPPKPSGPRPKQIIPFTIVFPPTTVKVLKVIVHPVGPLPSWHSEKGKTGYFFTDEIFVN